jgi:inorganic pyrophosphatase
MEQAVETPMDRVVARIEIAQGSRHKYRVFPSGDMHLSRVVRSARPCPANYGYLVDVFGPDLKELDTFVLASEPLAPGSMAAVRPVALFRTQDQDEEDIKLVSVLVDDHKAEGTQGVSDISKEFETDIADYLRTYKGYEIEVPGWEAITEIPGVRVERSSVALEPEAEKR